MKLKFGTLWFANKPTLLQQISWSSYLKHGHELHIFLYDMSIKIPDGAIKRNANEILSEDNIFMPKLNHKKNNVEHAEFSYADLFRVHMIKKENLVWTDSDMVCLNDEWPSPEPFLFGLYSNLLMGQDGTSGVNNDILYIQDKKILDEIIEEFKYIPKHFGGNRGLTGPNLLSSILLKNNLIGMAKEEKVFHAIRWYSVDYFLNSDKLDEVLELTKDSLAISFFHSSWVHHGLKIPNIDNIDRKNYTGYLANKYLIDSI